MNYLKLDDFIKYSFISKIKQVDKALAFLKHNVKLEENTYQTDLIFYDKINFKKLSSKVIDFNWIDDENIIYLSKEAEYYRLINLNITNGKEQIVLNIKEKIKSFKIISENKIALICEYNNLIKDLEKLSKEELEEYDDYIILDEIPFFKNGESFTNKLRNRLYVYNLKEGKLNPITNGFTDILDYKLNKDKDKMIFLSRTFQDRMELEVDFHIYDLKKNTIKQLGPKDHKHYYADFIENKIVLVSTDMKNYGLNENPYIYSMDLNGENIRKITNDNFDMSFGSTVGSDCRYGSGKTFFTDENFLYFISTDNFSSNLNRIDLNGNLERLTDSKGSVDDFSIGKNGIFFIGMRDLKLQEIYEIKNDKIIKISSFNDETLKNKKISKPEYINLKKDNLKIEGWIMKPVDFQKDKNFPVVLSIHGGPKTVFGDVFFHEMQYLANQNYFVVYCNPRGSDGKGRDFADIRGKYGSIDYEDLMDFLDLALENYPNMDSNRIGVLGGSYGGFMVNWIIGHTDRFRAAVSQRSISNWFSFFGTSDIGYYFTEDQQASNPWNDAAKLWEHSPLKYANRVSTPTLFIHSTEDYRCWMPEAMQMFTALKYYDVDSRLCLFKEENHELSRSGLPKHRIKRLKEISNWFHKYLRYNTI